MKFFGLAGASGSGKTTLIEALLPQLTVRGLSVSTIKHAHHGWEPDRPGKDSFRHAAAGAAEVLLAGDGRFALFGRTPAADPGALAARLAPVDLVLVEGFGAGAFPKIELHRPSLGAPPRWPEFGNVVAVATDAPLPACPHALLPINDAPAIAAWIVAFLELPDTRP